MVYYVLFDETRSCDDMFFFLVLTCYSYLGSYLCLNIYLFFLFGGEGGGRDLQSEQFLISKCSRVSW